ncbi:MAG: PilZ domain-containing protein [Deltaproteobacteria bacterium]|nr:PilZ domain-containing protein [Deltaproteobacteria bacterium]
MSTMLERRRSPRLALELPVTLRHGGRFIPATALNMSNGGMLIQADDQNVTTQAPVEIVFDLDPTHRDVALRGNILRVESQSLGIQFTNTFSESYRMLQEFLRNKTQS